MRRSIFLFATLTLTLTALFSGGCGSPTPVVPEWWVHPCLTTPPAEYCKPGGGVERVVGEPTTREEGADAGPERERAPEALAEAGPEREIAPEAGPEPRPERRPEARPEPGPEPKPEFGPEPPAERRPPPTLVFTAKQVGPLQLQRSAVGVSIGIYDAKATVKGFFLRRLTFVNDLSGVFGDNVVDTGQTVANVKLICHDQNGKEQDYSGPPKAGSWSSSPNCYVPANGVVSLGLEITLNFKVQPGPIRFGLQEVGTTKATFYAETDEIVPASFSIPTVRGSAAIKPHNIQP